MHLIKKQCYTFKKLFHISGVSMFISPNNISNQDELTLSLEKPIKQPWWDKKGFIVAITFSAVWLAFIWDYLFSSGWWGTRHDLSPAEFIGGLCGLFLPIIIAFLVSSYFDRAAQLGFEAQTLQSYLNELIYPTNSSATYTKSITNALREQVNAFKKIYTEVSEQTKELNNDIKKWSDNVTKMVQHLNVNAASSVREISESVEKLTEKSAQSGQQVAQSAVSFNEQIIFLQRAVKDTSTSFQPILSELKSYITELKKIEMSIQKSDSNAQNVLLKTNETTHKIDARINHIAQLVDSYVTNIQSRDKVLDERIHKAQSVLKLQNDVLEKSENFLKNHERIILQAQTSVRTHNNALSQSESLIKNHQESVEKSFTQAVQKIKETDLKIQENYDKINKTVSTTLSSLQELTKEIETATALQETLANKNKELTIQPQPTSIIKEENPVDFLQNATLILDKLQTFSIDMARIFTPKAEDTLWKKYHEGDKAVFMRHITRMISETQHRQIKDLYLENEEFNQAITRYMTEFEDMMKAVQNKDQNKLLMSILIGSDIGRLYMVLADVLKRQDD